MAQRQPVILTDKASTNPVVSGAALTAEFSNLGYPESSSKRTIIDMAPANRSASTGATLIELFVGGVANFRFRPTDQSTCMVKCLAAYTSSVAANDTVFEVSFGITMRSGTATILANSTNVKMPTASGANLFITTASGNLSLSGTGVTGDTNGRWTARLFIDEVSDLG